MFFLIPTPRVTHFVSIALLVSVCIVFHFSCSENTGKRYRRNVYPLMEKKENLNLKSKENPIPFTINRAKNHVVNLELEAYTTNQEGGSNLQVLETTIPLADTSANLGLQGRLGNDQASVSVARTSDSDDILNAAESDPNWGDTKENVPPSINSFENEGFNLELESYTTNQEAGSSLQRLATRLPLADPSGTLGVLGTLRDTMGSVSSGSIAASDNILSIGSRSPHYEDNALTPLAETPKKRGRCDRFSRSRRIIRQICPPTTGSLQDAFLGEDPATLVGVNIDGSVSPGSTSDADEFLSSEQANSVYEYNRASVSLDMVSQKDNILNAAELDPNWGDTKENVPSAINRSENEGLILAIEAYATNQEEGIILPPLADDLKKSGACDWLRRSQSRVIQRTPCLLEHLWKNRRRCDRLSGPYFRGIIRTISPLPTGSPRDESLRLPQVSLVGGDTTGSVSVASTYASAEVLSANESNPNWEDTKENVPPSINSFENDEFNLELEAYTTNQEGKWILQALEEDRKKSGECDWLRRSQSRVMPRTPCLLEHLWKNRRRCDRLSGPYFRGIIRTISPLPTGSPRDESLRLPQVSLVGGDTTGSVSVASTYASAEVLSANESNPNWEDTKENVPPSINSFENDEFNLELEAYTTNQEGKWILQALEEDRKKSGECDWLRRSQSRVMPRTPCLLEHLWKNRRRRDRRSGPYFRGIIRTISPLPTESPQDESLRLPQVSLVGGHTMASISAGTAFPDAESFVATALPIMLLADASETLGFHGTLRDDQSSVSLDMVSQQNEVLREGSRSLDRSNDGFSSTITQGLPNAYGEMISAWRQPIIFSRKFPLSRRSVLIGARSQKLTSLQESKHSRLLSRRRTFLYEGEDKTYTVNHEKKDQATAFIDAITQGMIYMVEFLIQEGVAINYRTRDGDTPLMIAIKCRNHAFRNFMRQPPLLRPRTSKNKCISSTRVHSTKIVKLLLEKGARIDMENTYGRTPLMIAVAQRDTAMAECLLDSGADIDQENSQGRTPLIEAIYQRDTDMIILLLDRNADEGSYL